MRLTAVLTRLELPVAELSALRLDGDAFALDDAVIAVDEPELAANRAHALAGLFDARMIAERDTALWVHGALASPPLVHTAAIRRDARGRVLTTTRIALRETTLADADLEVLGGVRVTTPARTVVDIALQDVPTRAEVAAVRALCRSPGTAAAALARADDLGHTPGKLRALRRIRAWAR